MTDTVFNMIVGQYRVTCYVEPCEDMPDWVDGPELDALLYRINHGDLDWFNATVEVIKNGHTIGSDYLGQCCYQSFKEFRKCDYFRDMVRQAIADARMTLNARRQPGLGSYRDQMKDAGRGRQLP